MIDCPVEYNFLQADTKYYLIWENGESEVASIDPFDIEEDPNKGSRYTGDCFRPKSPMEVCLKNFYIKLECYTEHLILYFQRPKILQNKVSVTK